jgi:hypothetical protein
VPAGPAAPVAPAAPAEPAGPVAPAGPVSPFLQETIINDAMTTQTVRNNLNFLIN